MEVSPHFVVVFGIMVSVTSLLGMYVACVKWCACCKDQSYTAEANPATIVETDTVKMEPLVKNKEPEEYKSSDELDKLMVSSDPDAPESMSPSSNLRFDIPLRPPAPLGHYTRHYSTPSTSGLSSGYTSPSTQDVDVPEHRLQVSSSSLANSLRNTSEAYRPLSTVIDMEMEPLMSPVPSISSPVFNDAPPKTDSMSSVMSFGAHSGSCSVSTKESSSSGDINYDHMRTSSPGLRAEANIITTVAIVHVSPPRTETISAPLPTEASSFFDEEDVQIDFSDYDQESIPNFDFQRRWSLGV